MKPVVFLAVLTAVTVVILNILFMDDLRIPAGSSNPIDYKDFSAILLTAVAVIVAVLAIGIAVLAIWGFQEFEKRTREAAERVAKLAMDDYLSSAAYIEAVNKRIDDVMQMRVIAVGATPTTDMATTNATSSTPIPTLPVK
jgi:hypothetical protein